MASRDELLVYCSTLLDADRVQDVALNGLQIEGASEIKTVAVAVSCNQHTIDTARDIGAQALLVHHGLILGDRIGPIRGIVRQRLAGLIGNNINLIGYHLPLDGHPEIGNNALLAKHLNLTRAEPFAEIGGMPIGIIAETEPARELTQLASDVKDITGNPSVVLDGGPDAVTRIAVVSGSGYSTIQEAASRECDVLVTGDVREPTMGEARELGISVVVAGHEATERLGVQALAARLEQEFGIEWQFIEDPNPI